MRKGFRRVFHDDPREGSALEQLAGDLRDQRRSMTRLERAKADLLALIFGEPRNPVTIENHVDRVIREAKREVKHA